MNHYQTLGIPRDADAQAIKAAFRKLASAAHPDREHGDADRMAAINRAHEVLIDPERRAAYDETGLDQGPDASHLAGQMLAQFFKRGIEAGVRDLLGTVANDLNANERDLESHRTKAQAARKRYEKASGKVRVREGATNLVQGVIDQAIAEIDANLRKMDDHGKVLAAARELFAAYEQDPIAPTMRAQDYFTTGTATA